jgi:hypothetical protein
MCHNQFRAICAEIKEVKITNIEGLRQTQVLILPPVLFQHHLTPIFLVPCGMHSMDTILQMTTTKTQHAQRALTLQQRVLCSWNIAYKATLNKMCS